MYHDDPDVIIFLFQAVLSSVCLVLGVFLMASGELPIGSIEFWVSALVNFALLALCFIRASQLLSEER